MPVRLAFLLLTFAGAFACAQVLGPAPLASAAIGSTTEGEHAAAGCTVRGPASPDPVFARATDPPNVELDQRTILSPELFAFDRPVAGGERIVCVLTIRNRRERTTTYELLPRGLVGSKSPRATAEYVPLDDERAARTAASWLEPRPPAVRIDPRGIAHVPIYITVPSDPPKGSASAAIEVTPMASGVDAGDTAVGIVSAVAVPFLFTVGGDGRPELELRDVRAPKLRWSRDPWTLRADLDNEGTRHAAVQGRVRLRSVFGNTVASLGIAHPPLLPGGRQPVEATWGDVPWFGIYRYDLRLAPAGEDRADEVARADGWFVALPPWWVLAIAGVIVTLFVISRFRRPTDDDLEAEEDWDADGGHSRTGD